MANNNQVTPEPANHEEGALGSGRLLYLMTSPQCAIPQQLMARVSEQVEVVLPVLDPEIRYTLRMLCDPAFWDGLTRGEKSRAGVCMVYMVERHMLPLAFAGETSGHSVLYRSI